MTTAPTIADPVERVLDRLDGVRAEGSCQWSARCPSHTDRKPSLSIGVGDGGRALIRCHAGCALDDVLAAMNPPMTMADLFPKGTSPNGQKRVRRKSPPKVYQTFELAVEAAERQTQGKHADTWSYHRANGDGHFRVVRFDPPTGKKQYRPFHRTSRGWVQADPPGELSLYRLPELLNADTVYAFEGEKCVEAARKLGLTATTSAHGCKSPKKSDWTVLAGKRVVILPDADAGGRKYAQIVAGFLTSLDPPASVKIIELPDLPEHGDIVDFIEDRRMDAKDNAAVRIEIEALAEQSPVWQPETRAIAHKTEAGSPEPYRSGESMSAINRMSATARQLRETGNDLAVQVSIWLDRRGPETLDGIDYPIPYAAAAIGVSRGHFHKLGQIGRVRRLSRACDTPLALSERAILPLARLLPTNPEAIPQAIEAACELVKAESDREGRDKPKPVNKRHTSAAVDDIIGPVPKHVPVTRKPSPDADAMAIEGFRQRIAELADAAAIIGDGIPPDVRTIVHALTRHRWSLR